MLDGIIPLKPKNKPENGALQRAGTRTKHKTKTNIMLMAKPDGNSLRKPTKHKKLNGKSATQHNSTKTLKQTRKRTSSARRNSKKQNKKNEHNFDCKTAWKLTTKKTQPQKN